MSDVSSQATKDEVASVIDRHLPDLVALSHSIHATPELCFDETRSARTAADGLRAGGLGVTEGVYDLPTAFESRSGGGDLVVAVCAEYDALPGVGHACGHNIIAASAVGAGLALAAVADRDRRADTGPRHAGRRGRRRARSSCSSGAPSRASMPP